MGAGEYRLLWSPEGEQDLISIWRWGAREWSQEQADRHLFDIENACERLTNNPLLGRARDDLIASNFCMASSIVEQRAANRAIDRLC